MRYAMTITALASGVALLAATQLPAKASPTFDLKSSTSMLQLVKSGGGGGGGMGGGGGRGGGGRLNLGGGGMGGHNGGVSGGGMGHMGHMGGGGDGHMGRMARGDFNGGSNWHGRNFAPQRKLCPQ